MAMNTWKNVSFHFCPSSATNAFLVYRISWLRAKARKDRWEEEVCLLQSEIGWASNFFKFKADEWRRLSAASDSEGKRCYALAQEEVWSLLQAEASEQSDLVEKILLFEYAFHI